MTAPTIKRLTPEGNDDDVRYRIEGGDVREDWRAKLRPHETAWCEVSIWFGGDRLGSYGGTVWPSAWPELFEVLPRSAHGGGIKLTESGREAFAAIDPTRHRKRCVHCQHVLPDHEETCSVIHFARQDGVTPDEIYVRYYGNSATTEAT